MDSKNYVLDTNVLVDNPEAIGKLRNGEENKVYIPYTVLLELDNLKRKPHLTHLLARTIDIIQADRDLIILPSDKTQKVDDEGIMEEIFGNMITKPILVTNDRIFQIKAGERGLRWETYRDSNPFKGESQRYTGIVEGKDDEEFIPNSFSWDKGKPVFHGWKGDEIIDYQNDVWNVRPRNDPYQNLALTLMMHDDIDLVTLQSEAGYGKTFLALAAALYLTLQEKDNPYKKIYVTKPMIEIGGSLGYLPGSLQEKMAPYMRYVLDLILKLNSTRNCSRIFVKDSKDQFKTSKFEVLPLQYIRGMNLENCIVIYDEVQNSPRSEVRTFLTRMGENVKCFALGDVRQVDHPYLNESNNGLNWTVKMMKGQKRYAHLVIKGKKSRGPITDMVLSTGL